MGCLKVGWKWENTRDDQTKLHTVGHHSRNSRTSGAVLHGHLSAMVDRRWLIKEGTYDQNCWRSEDMRLAISESRPDDQGGWQRCVDLRAEADTAEEFDDEVYHSIVLNREETEGEGSAVWEKFELCFIRIWDLVWYRPLTERYVWQALQDLRDQNLQYAEWRVVTGNLFDLGGRKYTVEEEVEFYLDIQRRFVQEVGPIEMRIIPCASRDQDRETVGAKMRETFFLRQKYPDFVIGFDVVGEEDTGRETLYYLDQYLELKALEAEYNLSLPLFFHDGESVKTDNQNLIDAFLMGTQRVGHAYNLFRFPDLIKTAREEEVGLEICPISNQLLKLVADLRNHPAASYIASGLPITVSPDDPGVLQYEGVHYDYYMAVMSWNVDLAALKTLARNSLALSAMEPERKLEYLAVHESLWDRWIDELLAGWVAQQPTWRTENSAVVAEISR